MHNIPNLYFNQIKSTQIDTWVKGLGERKGKQKKEKKIEEKVEKAIRNGEKRWGK